MPEKEIKRLDYVEYTVRTRVIEVNSETGRFMLDMPYIPRNLWVSESEIKKSKEQDD